MDTYIPTVEFIVPSHLFETNHFRINWYKVTAQGLNIWQGFRNGENAANR